MLHEGEMLNFFLKQQNVDLTSFLFLLCFTGRLFAGRQAGGIRYPFSRT